MPLPEIDRAIERSQYDYEVDRPLGVPVPLAAHPDPDSRVAADGDWRYDVETLDFLAGDEDDLTPSGLTYTFTSARPRPRRPDARRLRLGGR